MVKIRLARSGAKKRPFYHIVVTDMRNKRDGSYIERLGFFNPVAVGGEVPLRLDAERVEHWKQRGAQLSERVTQLVKYFNRHGEGVNAPRAEAASTKGREAAAQAVPAGDQGDQSGAASSETAAP